MTAPLPLHIVIPNWNGYATTVECMDSLLLAAERSGRAGEISITVVDNGSSDDSATKLGERYGAALTVLSLAQNRGFAAAVNAGMRHAWREGAASVLLLNNDTVAHADMLLNLMRCAGVTRDALLSAAVYYHHEPTRVWRLGDRFVRLMPLTRAVRLKRGLRSLLEVDLATGCALFVPRAAAERVGEFDEGFFLYFEDADYCVRAKRAGLRIFCCLDAIVWHKVSASSDSRTRTYWQSRSRLHFYRKHWRGRQLLVASSYVAIRSTLSLASALWRRDTAEISALGRGLFAGLTAP